MISKATHVSGIQRFKTLENDFNTIHRNKYNYDGSIFVNMLTKIQITCPEHGVFFKTPAKHISGQGCPFCSSARKAAAIRSSTAEFIKKAKLIAPRFDYSKVVYESSNQKIIVMCKEHGDFFITPNKLLAGKGCPTCKSSTLKKKLTKSFSDVNQQFKSLHPSGNYSLVDSTYVNAKTPMDIVCNIHGTYRMSPDNFLNKKSICPTCASINAGNKLRNSNTKFINSANKVHNFYYSYDNTLYIKRTEKVTITCPIHGDFEQLAGNHLAGKGCSICTVNYSYTPFPTKLYYVQIAHPTTHEVVYKIGITTQSIYFRFREELKRGYKISILSIYEFLEGKTAYEYEQLVLRKFKKYKRDTIIPFLYRSAGDTELFTINIKDYYE